MSTRGEFRVTAVQGTPAYFDRGATLDIVVDHVQGAGIAGADLVVFPESFVPGYPDWVWRRKPWSDDEWYARFQDQAIEIPGPALDKVCAAAEAAGVWVALGITERSSSGTLYNAVVYIDSSGRIAGLHRKLVTTGAERLVWGNGQGPMLTVVDIGGVRVGSLICWENYMPLARAPLPEGDRRTAGPNMGQQRRMGADASPHCEGRPSVRRRRHCLSARLRRAPRPPWC